MTKVFLYIILVLFSTNWVSSKTYRVLFIGNSYTAVNDLPNTFRLLAESLGDTVVVDNNTPGGMTFNGHTLDVTTKAKIMQGGWDFVILQAQSQEPSFSPGQVQTDTYPYAKTLDSLIKAYNTCAETMFYMTWGRKNGDASNCSFYPPVCTYAGMQQRLRESYLEMAKDNHASCAPVGMAWKVVRDSMTNINLYQADESHPSIHGTYLTACVFYNSIFHKSTYAAQYVPVGIGTADGLQMQYFSDKTVFDSLEIWQQDGDIPFASFNFIQNANQVNFTNTSKRYTNSNWNFGDGNTSILTNPIHNYITNNTFSVKLLVDNGCKTSNSSKNIITNSVGLSNLLLQEHITIQFSTIEIYNSDYTNIAIYSIDGKKILSQKLVNGNNSVPYNLDKGLYLIVLDGGKKYNSFKINL